MVAALLDLVVNADITNAVVLIDPRYDHLTYDSRRYGKRMFEHNEVLTLRGASYPNMETTFCGSDNMPAAN